jgi:hypothetical protein
MENTPHEKDRHESIRDRTRIFSTEVCHPRVKTIGRMQQLLFASISALPFDPLPRFLVEKTLAVFKASYLQALR